LHGLRASPQIVAALAHHDIEVRKMADEKQTQSGNKPNKFDEQNRGTEERKAGENLRQGEPNKEPVTDTPVKPDTAAQKQ
jgi:hypothetical protein